jgi:hypothetical protein
MKNRILTEIRELVFPGSAFAIHRIREGLEWWRNKVHLIHLTKAPVHNLINRGENVGGSLL